MFEFIIILGASMLICGYINYQRDYEWGHGMLIGAMLVFGAVGLFYALLFVGALISIFG